MRKKKKNARKTAGVSGGGMAAPFAPTDSWMQQKMEDKKWASKKLSEIVMPGSHNAATNVIQDGTFIGKLAGFAAKTQDVSPYEQMKVGHQQ